MLLVFVDLVEAREVVVVGAAVTGYLFDKGLSVLLLEEELFLVKYLGRVFFV